MGTLVPTLTYTNIHVCIYAHTHAHLIHVHIKRETTKKKNLVREFYVGWIHSTYITT